MHIKGYTGEGFWSVGRTLNSDQPFLHSRPLCENELPHSLCGGTYRHRRRQQTNAPKRKLTYAERQQRKKERKFGAGEGERVGGDDTIRAKLEPVKTGKLPPKAPKIASSNRSRELRAAAALKRLEVPEELKGESEESDAEYEWKYDEEDEKNAVDVGGGKKLVPVSAKEGVDDQEERNREWLELRGCVTVGCHGVSGIGTLGGKSGDSDLKGVSSSRKPTEESTLDCFVSKSNHTANSHTTALPPVVCIDNNNTPPLRELASGKQNANDEAYTSGSTSHQETTSTYLAKGGKIKSSRPAASTSVSCAACSTINGCSETTCVVCANVLDPKTYQGSWKCRSGGEYWNSPDYGRCMICGETRTLQDGEGSIRLD